MTDEHKAQIGASVVDLMEEVVRFNADPDFSVEEASLDFALSDQAADLAGEWTIVVRRR